VYELLTGLSPFALNGRKNLEDDIVRRIVNTEPLYPEDMSSTAYNFISSLLIKNPENRLGGGPNDARELKQHPFFMDAPNFCWQALERKEVEPPFVPSITHELDTKYFSEEFTKASITDTPEIVVPKHKNLFKVSFLDFVYCSL